LRILDCGSRIANAAREQFAVFEGGSATSDETIVLGVGADPEPDDVCADHPRQRWVVQTDSR
jgi:hypothetical protein